MKRFCIVLLLMITVKIGFSQKTHSVFQTYNKFSDRDSANIYFRFENFNFFKNNEYDSQMAEGYTLIGTMFRPQLVYYLNSKVRISMGATLLKYSGEDKFNRALPYFSAICKIGDNESVIFGNLNSDYNHYLPDFLIDPEKFYSSEPESGFQYLMNTRNLYLDCWVDWKKFIELNDPFQENFTMGISGRYTVKIDNLNCFYFPLYVLVEHLGGEIDNCKSSVNTAGSFSYGLCYEKQLSSSLFENLHLGIITSNFKNIDGNELASIDKGTGFSYFISTNTKYGHITAEYWSAEDYFSLYGLELFNSVNRFAPQYYESKRELLNFKYECAFDMGKELKIGGSVKNYYDLSAKRNNISASVYLVLNSNIFLKKSKR